MLKMFVTTNFNFFQVLKEIFWPLIIVILAMLVFFNFVLKFNLFKEKYEELERQKRQEWHWKGVKKGIGFMSILVISGTAYVFYVYGLIFQFIFSS